MSATIAETDRYFTIVFAKKSCAWLACIYINTFASVKTFYTIQFLQSSNFYLPILGSISVDLIPEWGISGIYNDVKRGWSHHGTILKEGPNRLISSFEWCGTCNHVEYRQKWPRDAIYLVSLIYICNGENDRWDMRSIVFAAKCCPYLRFFLF